MNKLIDILLKVVATILAIIALDILGIVSLIFWDTYYIEKGSECVNNIWNKN